MSVNATDLQICYFTDFAVIQVKQDCCYLYYIYFKHIVQKMQRNEGRDWSWKIISVRCLDINEDICACLINWKKAFDRVNLSKFIELLNTKE